MPNGWGKQDFRNSFDFELVTSKKAIIMFERMKIAKSSYEDLVETSTKKLNRSGSKSDGHSRKIRIRYVISKPNPEMGCAVKINRSYLELQRGTSPPTCIVPDKGHSSEDYKVLRNFGRSV